MGGGGGGGKGGSAPSAPVVQPAPKQEVTKPVTEAATAARQTQKEKANKAAGLKGSILTSDFAPAGGQNGQQGKTLLGQ